MIDITSFLLKHLYELMADNYNATIQRDHELAMRQQQRPRHELSPASRVSFGPDEDGTLVLEGDCQSCDNNNPIGGGRHHPIECCATQASNSTTTTAANNSSESQGQNAIRNFFKKFNYCQQQGRQQQDQREQQTSRRLLAREQETNQQIVSFLINNQLPDLACETLIELIFISVFLAISWIFVMIIQLHCQQQQQQFQNHELEEQHKQQLTSLLKIDHQMQHYSSSSSYESARYFYCNTKFLNSLMYCNNKESRFFSS